MCYVWASLIILLFLPVQLPGLSTSNTDEELPRIAVIGAGIGGTSSAYYLRQLFGHQANIDIYEAKEVGGRLATVYMAGQDIEAGGSIIHPRNNYMVNLTELLGLEKRIIDDDDFGIYDGDQFQFQSSDYSLITKIKALWRYGRDIYRLSSWVNDNLMTKFSRIYTHQMNGYAFTTVKDLLLSMDPLIANLTTRSIQEVLQEDGFSERFIKELVTVAVRNNYGQATDIHALVGAVSLAGAQNGLWAVKGGNKLVAKGLLEKSHAKLIQAKVTKIILLKESNSIQYELEYELNDAKDGDDSTQSSIYDIVIVAVPLNKNIFNLQFEDFSSALHSFIQPYQRTVATFLKGQVNASFFKSMREDLPNSILINKEPYFINSMENMVQDVWKVFSRDILSESEKELLFKKVDQTLIYDWQAYPKYSSRQSLPSFVLYDQLYYVNAIESAASAMEMSVIGGRNAALLAYNHWHSLLDFVDETQAIKTEAEKDKKEL